MSAGPFLGILLAKLENMLQNSLYVNFLLTGLLAQLACYPQPLLRSFLLNTNMVFQPSVKSLLQVALRPGGRGRGAPGSPCRRGLRAWLLLPPLPSPGRSWAP